MLIQEMLNQLYIDEINGISSSYLNESFFKCFLGGHFIPEIEKCGEENDGSPSIHTKYEFQIIVVILVTHLIFNIMLKDQIPWASFLVIPGYITIYIVAGRREFLRWFPIYLTLLIYDILDYMVKQIPADNMIIRFRLDHGLFSYNFDKKLLSHVFAGEPPSHYFMRNHILSLDIVFGVAYILTLGALVIFPFYIRSHEPIYFRWIAWSGVLTAIIISIIFMIFPTTPPWFSFYYGNNPTVGIQIDKNYAAGGLWNLEKSFSFLPITDILSKLTIFQFGYFPSIHIVISSHIYLFLKHMENKYSRLAFVMLLINSLGVVYLAHHYVADVIGALILSRLIVTRNFCGKPSK